MKTEQLIDCEGITLESTKPFAFSCCDCGLTHHMVIVSEDGKPVGFAVKRVAATPPGGAGGSVGANKCDYRCAGCEGCCGNIPVEDLPHPAPAETKGVPMGEPVDFSTLGAAMRAIRQCIQMIDRAPDHESEALTAAVRRTLRGAVLIAEESGEETAAPAQSVSAGGYESACERDLRRALTAINKWKELLPELDGGVSPESAIELLAFKLTAAPLQPQDGKDARRGS